MKTLCNYPLILIFSLLSTVNYGQVQQTNRQVMDLAIQTNKNKEIVNKYFQMWNTGDSNIADEILSQDYVDYAHPEIHGHESVKQSLVKIRNMFPDFQITIETIISEKNKVAVLGKVFRTKQGKETISEVIWLVTIVDDKMKDLQTGVVSVK